MSVSAFERCFGKSQNTYVAKQVFHDIALGGESSRLNRVLVQFVLLRQTYRLLPSLVLTVDVGSDLPEEDKLMLLKP